MHGTVVDRIYKRVKLDSNPNVTYLHHPSGVTVLVYDGELPYSVVEVDYGNGKKGINRSEQTKKEGGKKGALRLQADTKICTIKLENGEYRVIRSGVKAFLAEVNTTLSDSPDLIRSAPENQGYIAIVTCAPGQRQPIEFNSARTVTCHSLF